MDQAALEQIIRNNDVILVAGTSFLKRVSTRHIWAVQVISQINQLAGKRGSKCLFLTPLSSIAEYNHSFETGKVDDFGVPEALTRLEDMMPLDIWPAEVYQESSRLAAEAWRKSPEGKRRENDDLKETRTGYADQDARTFAIDLAKRGAKVYFASYDFGDEIRPLQLDPELEGIRKNLTFLPPSKLEAKYLPKGVAVLTGAVIGKLQAALSTPTYQDCVLFEKNVRSGDVTFDAGVGVVRKEYLRPFELPSEFSSISENSYRLPIVKVKSMEEPSTLRTLLIRSREFRLPMVVVDESKPFFPLSSA